MDLYSEFYISLDRFFGGWHADPEQYFVVEILVEVLTRVGCILVVVLPLVAIYKIVRLFACAG